MNIKEKIRSSQNIYIILGLIVLTFIGFSIISIQKEKKDAIKEKILISNCDHVKYASAPIAPQKKLNDGNDLHLLHAQINGLKQTFNTNEEFDSRINNLVKNNILVEVTENRFYKIKPLTHSQPYLIPEAVDMLNEIGFRFQEQLKEKKHKNYCIILSSLLRTEETQKKLSKRNHNATSHSAHLYGTTVDITYKNFYNTENDTIESSYDGQQALMKVLSEMREECKLLVVRERKQACFHISVVVCKPMQL